MATQDEQTAERRAAADKGAKRAVKHPDPSTFDADELMTPSGKRITVSDQEFAVMLERAGGFRTRVAKQLGVTVSAITHRIKRSKYLTEVCKTVDETILDLAEAQLVKAAQDREPWAITFILKCKGRKRGWIERQDVAFGGDPDALPPPIVLAVHDPGFIEAERERQKRELAEVVDAAYTDLMPQGSTEASTGMPGTSGPTAQPLDDASGNGADVAPTEGSSGAESQDSGREAELSAPDESRGPAQGDGVGANIAPMPPAPQPRVPRTPSEAAAMRREQEARDRAANGGGHGEQQMARPYRAVPVAFSKR